MDSNRDPTTKARKRARFINHGSTLSWSLGIRGWGVGLKGVGLEPPHPIREFSFVPLGLYPWVLGP